MAHAARQKSVHGWLALPLLVLTSSVYGEEGPSKELIGFDSLIKPKDRSHWAFQPVHAPSVPLVKDTVWPRNPIDAFVLAKLEARDWKPATPASPRALLRRLCLDLTGVPPTIAEQDAFLNDPSPMQLDRIVADLLSRPAYGERWGRHWLDLVRYAETNGYERDATKPHVWRYRDYVIRAFNDDKPFHRFILQQLAGDELPDSDGESLTASGYCRLGPWDDEPADPEEDRFDQLDDMVSTTSLVFLGMTLGCARCHNHKFEPLTQHDYYRMVAIFSPLQRPQFSRLELDLPLGTRAQIDRAARCMVAARLAGLTYPLPAAGPSSSPWQAALSWLAAESRVLVPTLPRGYYLHEPAASSPATHLLLRGKASRPGPQVEPGLPTVLVSTQPTFLQPGPRTSRRRLTLARWIGSPDNPLTARVLVNRVWQFHFGEGLVRTPSDFGVMGQRPTHPELLDWLADRFVKEGWSLKKLHRLILTSYTYRMSKTWNSEYGAKDAEDRLLWRVPYRRLEVEAIRDSMLAISGRLNPMMYGPSMYPEVPKEALAGHSDPDKIWRPFDEWQASRRTIYTFLKRSMIVPMLEVLDLCDTARSSDRRAVTTVAPQALSLFNGDFVNRQAKHLAARVLKEAGKEAERQIERAYLLALCRPPSESERSGLVTFLRQEEADARRSALEQMCRVIFNLNEFVYTD